MKKRRKFAEKLKVAMCLLSVIASTLFYAPMSVEASASASTLQYPVSAVESDQVPFSGGISSPLYLLYICHITDVYDSQPFDFSPYLNGGSGLYKVTFNVHSTFTSSRSDTQWRSNFISFSSDDFLTSRTGFVNAEPAGVFPIDTEFSMYVDSSSPVFRVSYSSSPYWQTYDGSVVNFNFDYAVSNVVAEKVAQTDTEQYQQGYRDGLAEGQKQGYNNGYSEGFAKGENEGYNKGFQAGVNSVDTDSIYEAGRQAGYDAGYQKGYDNGHKAGYDEAMERIESWGADTTKYPVELTKQYFTTVSHRIDFHSSGTNIVLKQNTEDELCLALSLENVKFDPNHLYKVRLDVTESVFRDVGIKCDDISIYYRNGAYDYFLDWVLSNGDSNPTDNEFYIKGSDLVSASYFYCKVTGATLDNYNVSGQIYIDRFKGYAYLYDYGPVNNTQNQIANQTDQLTHGYDSSAGNASHDKFQGSVNEYEAAEDSLFATATDNIAKFEFFDFQSIAAVMTGITFVTSTMTKIFDLSGGISGVGIILSVLFSVMLVSMALGLYKRYQSTGHGSSGNKSDNKSDKGGGS